MIVYRGSSSEISDSKQKMAHKRTIKDLTRRTCSAAWMNDPPSSNYHSLENVNLMLDTAYTGSFRQS